MRRQDAWATAPCLVGHGSGFGQVERGRRNISLHNILKIAEGLGIDPGELVWGLRAPEG